MATDSHLGPPLWQGCEQGGVGGVLLESLLLRLAFKIHVATRVWEVTEGAISSK